jgi:osmoprotectant transport system substrate-binding protein
MKLAAVLVLALVPLSSVALAPSLRSDAEAGAATTPIVVGAKNFPGAQVLSQVYGQGLEAKGRGITFKSDLGPTEVVFPALLKGDIDASADYQGTLLAYLGGTPTADRDETFTALQAKLAGTGVVAGKPAPAVDKNGFYVTAKTAKKYRLAKVSDLTAVAPQLVLGAPPECAERPLCLGAASQALYHLVFKDVQKLDPGGPTTAKALTRGDIDVAVLFTGSSVIPSDAVLLRDDRGLQPADNPVFLLRESVATPATIKAVDAISATITTAAYNRMSRELSEQQRDPADIAAAFLARNHLD